MVGGSGKEIDIEVFMRQVDWQEFVQLTSPETIANNSSVENSPICPRELQMDQIKLTPEQQEQVRRLHKNEDGLVACQVIQYDNEKPPRPEDDDDDQLTKQRDKIKKEDDQKLHEGILANKALGKRDAWPAGPQLPDQCPDAWEPADETERLKQAVKTKDSKFALMETEMRRMQKDLDDFYKGKLPPQTPVQQSTATPDAPRRHGDCNDINKQSTTYHPVAVVIQTIVSEVYIVWITGVTAVVVEVERALRETGMVIMIIISVFVMTITNVATDVTNLRWSKQVISLLLHSQVPTPMRIHTYNSINP